MHHTIEVVLPVRAVLAAIVFGLAATWLFERAGEAQRRAVLLGSTVTLLALAGAFVFGLDQLHYGLSENGPQYYPFSAYVQYRRALHGTFGQLAPVAYAAVPAIFVVAAVLAGRWRRPVGVALGFAALAAPALPLAVASALPRSEYGKDAVLHLEPGSWPPSPGSAISPCFQYSVERPGATPDSVGQMPPTLCLRLKPTPAAQRLASTSYRPEQKTIYDVAYELNRTGVKPYDFPKHLNLPGIEISRAWWKGRPAAELSRAPRQAAPITDRELRTRQLQWARSAARRVVPGRNSGCAEHAISARRSEPGPPAPSLKLSRHPSWVEIGYQFRGFPRSPYCQPYAVVAGVYAGRPGDETFAISSSRARVTKLQGTTVVDFTPLRGQSPDRLEVFAVSLANWRSKVITVRLK